MKFVDEFRDPAKAQALIKRIHAQAKNLPPGRDQPLQIMEVCGGHTHSIFRYGLQALLPDALELVHGPGCPVCVLPMDRVDAAVSLAEQDGIILATFGDAMRVPGSGGSLLQAKARGADIRMVYSPLDALQLARDHPDHTVVFFALGFETTMPATALTLLQAEAENQSNFRVLCQHITIIPTLRALLDMPGLALDAFIGPGHVSAIIGTTPYAFISDDYGKPVVVAGFEPLDILHSLSMLLEQFVDGRCEVENQYQRVVAEGGNTAAQQAMHAAFVPRPRSQWRGLGEIAESGVMLHPRLRRFDAEPLCITSGHSPPDPAATYCGNVLTGRSKPQQCPLFGSACTPENPVGALMVSSEGACAAVYQYRNSDTTA